VSYSQQVSIIDVRTYVLAFDFERKRYQLLVETGEGQNRVLNPAGGRFGKLFLVPKDITISGSSNRIFFYPDGHSDKVEIKMEDKNDKSIFVTTTGLLGNSIVREEG